MVQQSSVPATLRAPERYFTQPITSFFALPAVGFASAKRPLETFGFPSIPLGARSAAGTDDGLVTYAECATRRTLRGHRRREVPPITNSISGVSGFLCLAFFAAAKKVSAAPHRGNANKPIRKETPLPQANQKNTIAAEKNKTSPVGTPAKNIKKATQNHQLQSTPNPRPGRTATHNPRTLNKNNAMLHRIKQPTRV
ncbi:hypothetical protein P3T18_003558 [Paraburkholderia sp. GAS199]|uniref:hypothetical protein n=1 Tax=Paraburkholderia sp. GAS199 TaxID=3035126 RepID=UPI003D2262A0